MSGSFSLYIYFIPVNNFRAFLPPNSVGEVSQPRWLEKKGVKPDNFLKLNGPGWNVAIGCDFAYKML